MIPLGLTADDTRALRTQLTVTRQVQISLRATDLSGGSHVNLSGYLTDGQVNVDWGAPITRSMTVTLNDPKRSLPFDTDHPADTALFFDRMLQAIYRVKVGDEWIGIPVFTGPVTKLDRDGDTVTVECQGKELLAQAACWRPLLLHKGMRKTDAIIRLLSERAGEDSFDFPHRTAQLPRPISVAREQTPWAVARRIAIGLGLQLFYDGRGTARMRPQPNIVGFTFTGEHHVVSPLQVSYTGDVVNAVSVRGGIPKGGKRHVTAFAAAPASHPLSPQRLGRNGVPRVLLPDGQVIRDDSIKTHKEAATVARRRLHDGLIQHVEVSFDAVPIPFLDPGDLCHVKTDDGSVTFRIHQYSLPLGTSSSPTMSIGYHKNASLARTKRRNRP